MWSQCIEIIIGVKIMNFNKIDGYMFEDLIGTLFSKRWNTYRYLKKELHINLWSCIF